MVPGEARRFLVIMDHDLELWRRMCRCRYFDTFCERAITAGRIKTFTYLSTGQEAIAAAASMVFQDQEVNLFCQHRNHAVYVSFGGDVSKLRDELLGFDTGTTAGMGGDPCHHAPQIGLWGHCGLVADHVPIGVGMALATGKPSVIFCGDSCPEEDVFWPAVGLAATHRLPVLFIIEDNDLSVLTRVRQRRCWRVEDVANAFGVYAMDLIDDPWRVMSVLRGARLLLPAVVNISTNRLNRHVGAGRDNSALADRLGLTKSRLLDSGEETRVETLKIEAAAVEEMAALWEFRVAKQASGE